MSCVFWGDPRGEDSAEGAHGWPPDLVLLLKFQATFNFNLFTITILIFFYEKLYVIYLSI